MSVLEVKNYTKIYDNVAAADNVSFQVAEGEIFGLIGPNGAGKSTTLRAVATILKPTSGEIVIDGHNLRDQADQARRVISYLPEEAGAYKNLTGKQYLEFMAALFLDTKEEQRLAIEFAEEVCGLNDRLKSKVGTYSKGMTRKLLLARTVMSRPKLAILDEPTSGLDVINALEIRKIIRDLAKKGMSVLLSGHNMLEIDYLCERIAIINRGKILETGTPTELKKKHNAQNLEEVFVTVAEETRA